MSVNYLQKKDQTVCQIFLVVKLMARPQKLCRFPWLQLHSRVSTAQSGLRQEMNLEINLSGTNNYNAAICSKAMDNKIHLQRTLEHGTNTLFSGYASGSIFIADNFIIHIFFSFNCQHLAIYNKDLEQILWGIYNCFYLHTGYIYFYFWKPHKTSTHITKNSKICWKGNVILYFAWSLW